jgi:transcriptional regulator with XRE-family HTH domain
MANTLEFGGRLAEERKRLSLNQTEFAKACGVKSASQFLYEKGDRTPNAEYLLKAQSLGVRIDYLFAGEAALIKLTVNAQELGRLFKRVDDLSRDSLGRLSDLESRVKLFMELLESGEGASENSYKFSVPRAGKL